MNFTFWVTVAWQFFKIILNHDYFWELCFIELPKEQRKQQIASGNNMLITNEVLIVLLTKGDILLIVS